MIIEREISNSLHGDCVNASYSQVTAVKFGIKEYKSPLKSSLNGSPLAWFGIIPKYSVRTYVSPNGMFEYVQMERIWLMV